MIDVKKVNVEDTYHLRHKILRPHQSIEQCRYSGDFDLATVHFAAFGGNDHHIVGILSIYKVNHTQLNTTECWQLRAMATCESIRGTGVGLELLSHAESYISGRQGRCIWANARLNAIGFYQKAGYSILGDEFDILGVGPHYLVYKAV